MDATVICKRRVSPVIHHPHFLLAEYADLQPTTADAVECRHERLAAVPAISYYWASI